MNRSAKELIRIIIDFIESKNPVDGRLIREGSHTCYGICHTILFLLKSRIITKSESEFIEKFLYDEIMLNIYPNFECQLIGSVNNKNNSDGIYFFSMCQWSTRIAWLKEVLNRLN